METIQTQSFSRYFLDCSLLVQKLRIRANQRRKLSHKTWTYRVETHVSKIDTCRLTPPLETGEEDENGGSQGVIIY